MLPFVSRNFRRHRSLSCTFQLLLNEATSELIRTHLPSVEGATRIAVSSEEAMPRDKLSPKPVNHHDYAESLPDDDVALSASIGFGEIQVEQSFSKSIQAPFKAESVAAISAISKMLGEEEKLLDSGGSDFVFLVESATSATELWLAAPKLFLRAPIPEPELLKFFSNDSTEFFLDKFLKAVFLSSFNSSSLFLTDEPKPGCIVKRDEPKLLLTSLEFTLKPNAALIRCATLQSSFDRVGGGSLGLRFSCE
ncbi:3-oxoacyl-[acyl-carrier-protein] synthase 2 [Striga asiatica]|uniref:3-oxoacyl-[acyl-carrier-protein] synthase 2 n=1 Tax=Striga asiatica TaxID=4170 RepID=A0A5A7QUF2_STRAF|nr:3-oxoacyl-[acyl-carrier-protein] synthase 2 [Striga asiatica]